MNKIINEIVNRVYLNKDNKYYKEKCRKNIDFRSIIGENISKYYVEFSEMNIENGPSCTWYFDLESFSNISYRTIVYISKIVPIAHIQHEFEVDDKNPDRLGPTLDGYGGIPYTKSQAKLEEMLKKDLEKIGYDFISYVDFNEVILNVKSDEVEMADGDKQTVYSLLFNDMLGILEK